ncbi:MAG: hypothetical protein WA418_21555 [Bradyrhizobium sp.]
MNKLVRSAVLLGALGAFCQPSNAQDADYAKSLAINLQNKDIVFNAAVKHPEDQAKAGPVSVPLLGEGYASIRYVVGNPKDRDNMAAWIDFLARVLPPKYGNTSGTYTITITVTDQSGQTALAKEPIISFQWDVQRKLIFLEQTVSDIQKSSWRGTLVKDLPIREAANEVRIGLEVYILQDRSLDFNLVKQIAQSASSGAGFLPHALLPAAAVPVIDTLGNLVNSVYQQDKKKTLVSQSSEPLTQSKQPITYPITFQNPQDGNTYELPVEITIDTRQSRLVNTPLVDSKFNPSSLSLTMFSNTSLPVVGKAVSIVELISTSSDPAVKSTRALLDALISGQSYGLDQGNKKESNVGPLCSNLYDALNRYLSPYDARAMFWAFLAKYKDQMRAGDCLGQLKSELEVVGLGLN